MVFLSFNKETINLFSISIAVHGYGSFCINVCMKHVFFFMKCKCTYRKTWYNEDEISAGDKFKFQLIQTGVIIMGTILLFLLAITPPAVLMVLIYWMDRHEPESIKNVVMAMVIGALSTIPAIIIEAALGTAPIFTLPGLAGRFYESFLLVAPSEELAKFFFIYLLIRKKPFYSEITDGIVYYGAGALGFALLENIFYVFDNGFSVGVLRALTAIPIHAFCGIIIGYHAGLARFRYQMKQKRLIFTGLFLAYLIHALFDTLVSADSLLTLLFIPLVALTYYAIYKILHRGRQLSVSRDPVVQHLPVKNYRAEDILTDSDGRKYLAPKREKWKAWISRLLLISTGLLWLLVFCFADISSDELLDCVLGMILLTIIPLMIGLLLQLSYRRRKRSKIYIDDDIVSDRFVLIE